MACPLGIANALLGKMFHLVGISFVYGFVTGLATCLIFSPHFDKTERQKFAETTTTVSLQSFHYNTLHSLDDREESVNMVTPETPVTQIDVDLDEQPNEGLISNVKEKVTQQKNFPSSLTCFVIQ